MEEVSVGLVRVLDDKHEAVGQWNPRLEPEDLRRFRSDQDRIAPNLLRERLREFLQPAIVGIRPIPDR